MSPDFLTFFRSLTPLLLDPAENLYWYIKIENFERYIIFLVYQLGMTMVKMAKSIQIHHYFIERISLVVWDGCSKKIYGLKEPWDLLYFFRIIRNIKISFTRIPFWNLFILVLHVNPLNENGHNHGQKHFGMIGYGIKIDAKEMILKLSARNVRIRSQKY